MPLGGDGGTPWMFGTAGLLVVFMLTGAVEGKGAFDELTPLKWVGGDGDGEGIGDGQNSSTLVFFVAKDALLEHGVSVVRQGMLKGGR